MKAPRHRTDRDLRSRILAAATELFAEKGFSATSVRELVEACRCTKPSLYYYFDSKETLFEKVVEHHMQACSSVIGSLESVGGGIREAVHGAVTTWVDWAIENPHALRLLQRVETRPEEGAPELNIAAARDFHLQLITSLIERGIGGGEIRPEVVPADCALIIAGSLSFQFELALGTGEWDRPRIHRTVDLIFDGIAA